MTQEKETRTAVAVKQNHGVTEKLLSDYLATLTGHLTDQQRAQFVAVAMEFGLNPFKREIYAVPYGNGLSIITGYEVYLKRAEACPDFDGYDVKFSGSPDKPADFSCTCTVYRKNLSHPVTDEVFFSESSQNNSMWKNKPRLMLKKVAIANAFRKAFPNDFGGLPYIADELPDKMTGGKTEIPKPTVQAPKPEAVEAEIVTQEPRQCDLRSMLEAFKAECPAAYERTIDSMHRTGWYKPSDVPPDSIETIKTWYALFRKNENAKEAGKHD